MTMILLTMHFRIPWIAAKFLLCDERGNINKNKAEAYYDQKELEELRDFPGLKWKVWAISRNGRHATGVYLFAEEDSARLRRRFARKFYWRKGLFFLHCHLDEVLEGCSRTTRAPIDVPGNPPATEMQAASIMQPHLENGIKKFKRKYRELKKVGE